MRLQVFNPGEEPLIAAAVMDLFALLPQASHFVESLVKQTIRLESALPKYKPCRSNSPFRDPLAKYLNRHFASKSDVSRLDPFIECWVDIYIGCFMNHVHVQVLSVFSWRTTASATLFIQTYFAIF